ncbi:hypothetical protein MCOR25_011150, partial [Pyricularia grisea]
MRFSIACTIAVLLQTALTAPLNLGNSPPTTSPEASTDTILPSHNVYRPPGLDKRGRR